MPATAISHFQQDLGRARAIAAHADPLPHGTPAEQLLRSDLWRSAWMFGVGALDAYFCDAYTDIVAATIIAKSRHPALILPEFFHDIRFPVRAILEPYANNINWRWRMAARKMMERENVLSLATVQTLFNKFFRSGQRFFREVLPTWIYHPDSRRRVFGITAARFNALPANLRGQAVADAQARLEERFREIFQRRHDCIHNCDRPRVKPQPLTAGNVVLRVLEDVEFLVRRCNDHINLEFRHFLLGMGCPAAVVGQVGY
ncbi:MAG: hypothetical protein JO112_02540 [Planctomycetes bacterium]|nr:hypothetical protein [Planctomycetota bacterium]